GGGDPEAEGRGGGEGEVAGGEGIHRPAEVEPAAHVDRVERQQGQGGGEDVAEDQRGGDAAGGGAEEVPDRDAEQGRGEYRCEVGEHAERQQRALAVQGQRAGRGDEGQAAEEGGRAEYPHDHRGEGRDEPAQPARGDDQDQGGPAGPVRRRTGDRADGEPQHRVRRGGGHESLPQGGHRERGVRRGDPDQYAGQADGQG